MLAQLNPTVGALEQNTKSILDIYKISIKKKVRNFNVITNHFFILFTIKLPITKKSMSVRIRQFKAS